MMNPQIKQPLREKQVCLMHPSFSLKKNIYSFKNGEGDRGSKIYMKFQILSDKFHLSDDYISVLSGNWR